MSAKSRVAEGEAETGRADSAYETWVGNLGKRAGETKMVAAAFTGGMRCLIDVLLIGVLLGSFVAAQQAGSPNVKLTLLEGRVVRASTGEPLGKAEVTLGSYEGAQNFEWVASTDAQGVFRFADVAPGSYKLTADKTGFLAGGYGEVEADDPPSLLTIGAGDGLPDLTLKLSPAGSISGRVLDVDGEPLPGRQVTLWTKHRKRNSEPNRPADDTTTNLAGEYRFDGMLPGIYYISTEQQATGLSSARQLPVDHDGHPSKLHDLKTFYPGVLRLAEAQAIRLGNGQDLPDLEVRVQRGPLLSVSGRIAGAAGSFSKYSLTAASEQEVGPASPSATIEGDGEFVLEDLTPGPHRLALLDHSKGEVQVVGGMEINLGEQDLAGISIVPFTPAKLGVRVAIEGERTVPEGAVMLSALEKTGSGGSVFEKHNGFYVFDHVAPGTYGILFNNAPDAYLKSVQSGNEYLPWDAIPVAEGAALDLQLTYSKKMAAMSGDVEAAADRKSKRAVRVLLISEEGNGSGAGRVVPGEVDQYLHFSVERLRPGKYLAVATQEGDFDFWESPEVLKSLSASGVEVDLRESDHRTVRLKLIPKEETDRLRRQLGI